MGQIGLRGTSLDGASWPTWANLANIFVQYDTMTIHQTIFIELVFTFDKEWRQMDKLGHFVFPLNLCACWWHNDTLSIASAVLNLISGSSLCISSVWYHGIMQSWKYLAPQEPAQTIMSMLANKSIPLSSSWNFALYLTTFKMIF